MEVNIFTSDEINKKIEILKMNPSETLAETIGKTIVLGKQTIDEKKDLFSKAFLIAEDNFRLSAILNAWAIAVMLQDSLPIPQKIIAFRSMLKDPEIKQELLNDWIQIVYTRMSISQDILEFIALDLRHHAHVSPEMKAMLEKLT